MKVQQDPWAALFPVPVVLVTSGDADGTPNLITLAWAGMVCSTPPTLGLGIRPQRHSSRLIDATGELVVNVPTEELLREVDYCGKVSGRKVDKVQATGLTLEPAAQVKPPLIQECPVNIECVVRQKIPIGVHHLFLCEIVQVHVDHDVLNPQGQIDFTKVAPIAYGAVRKGQGEYWGLKQKIGVHGFSTQ
jgi:flavin reductase (DIM6/NTAB) family NADH-FMN oxidoreductase RutF